MSSSTIRFLAMLAPLAGALSVGGSAFAADQPQIAECRIGFDSRFKVGCWTPIWVAVSGDVAERPLRVTGTTVDSDGVPVSVSKPVTAQGNSVERVWPVELYVNVGRIGAPVVIRLLSDDDTVLDRFELAANASDKAHGFRPMLATSELVVQLGSSAIGLDEAYLRPGADGESRALVRLLAVDSLPTEWFGYETLDVLVLTTADTDIMKRLAKDRQRFDALRRWVALGGRLVVVGSGKSARELLGAGGPLAEFAPGTLDDIVRLTETGPLEHYATSEVPLATGAGRSAIMVPQFVGVEGRIEVYAGRRPSDLPLVVRSPRGLGEATFVGLDLAASPLAEWPGRKPFLQAVLRPYVSPHEERQSAASSLVARGYNDLSGALRQRLGKSFSGVAPMAFSLVTVLAVAYLLALGPVDYLVVRRWLKRPWIGWITFPILVAAFGLAAMALGSWRGSGGAVRVNQIELVDIDSESGQARGTFWATLYSPRAEQFDFSLEPQAVGGGERPNAQILLSSWGLPGVGIGGMHTAGTNLDIIRYGYHYGRDLASLLHVPVLSSATKSLIARWMAPARTMIDAQLADEDGLVAGFVANRSDVVLKNVRLLYNGWAYRLGPLEPGGRIDVADEMSPRRMKTVVTQDAAGPPPPGQEEGNVFVAERATAGQILNLMMFYEAASGLGFARLVNDYQAYCDLSRLMELGRAILVAETATRGSRLVNAAGETIGDIGDSIVVYRFVLPVATDNNRQ
jgi:hypothetical protein